MHLSASVRRWLPWCLLAVLPFLAHAPLLLLGLSADPMLFHAELTPTAVHGPLPGLPGWNDPNSGFTVQALGGLAAQEWLHGRVPWWNPYSGVGLPLAGEMQPAVFFLPFALLLALSNGVLLLKIALQVMTGWADFALLCQLGLARRVALIGAILFELNGTFAWSAHAPIHPIPFLPLLLLGVERALSRARTRRRGGWAWVAVAIGFSLAAGFPETAYIDGLLALVWAALRLARLPGRARWHGLGKLALGGALGLAISAPATLPFLQGLGAADIGFHGQGSVPLPAPTYALFLIPYLYGPIHYDWQIDQWGYAGGYVAMAPCLLALLALRRRNHERGVRLLLAGWITLCVAESARLPGLTGLLDLLPFMQVTWFSRYCVPSCEFAVFLLVAFTLDDELRGNVARPSAVWAMSGGCAVALGIALLMAHPMLSTLLRAQPGYPWFLAGSLLWTLAVFATVTVLCLLRQLPRRVALLGATLGVNALVLFAFPLLSATHPVPLDTATVDFLRQHLGLARFFTLGPLQPNYGALFRLASINYNYMPVPLTWSAYVRAHFEPLSVDAQLAGFHPEGAEASARALIGRSNALAALGVRYVLAPIGPNPFQEQAGPRRPDIAPTAEPFAQGGHVVGTILSSYVHRGRIAGVAVTLATFQGAADGKLSLRLCSPRACADGTSALPGVGDYLPVPIELATPLAVDDGETLRYDVTRPSGFGPLAVLHWQYPQGAGPEAKLLYAGPPLPPRVFRGEVADVYEIASPAPYFEVRGAACTLAVGRRDVVAADCDGPATLLRRELFDPAWRAEVNGTATAVVPDGELFQTVALPKGRARVRFHYVPPYIAWAGAASALGVVGVIAGLWAARPGGPAATLRGRAGRATAGSARDATQARAAPDGGQGAATPAHRA